MDSEDTLMQKKQKKNQKNPERGIVVDSIELSQKR